MAQKTLVLKLDRARAAALRRSLQGGAFEFRSVPHAAFSARGEGVVATMYASGKLVVQGEDPELFAARHLDAAEGALAALPAASPRTPPRDLSEVLVGSDESGKGDFFGPLVVAAVRVEPHQARGLLESGVADSKTVRDAVALRLGQALQGILPHAIEVLEPERYNEVHARVRNLNPMLARLHADAIRRLARPGEHVLVDRFADPRVLERELADLDVRLEQRPRAEDNVAVAAASLIARAVFLTELRRLSDEYAVDLCKGAGPPVDRAGRRFLALHGAEKLGRVAKLHFRNSQKIGVRPT